VGAIHRANVAGGEIGKRMQEGKVTRVEGNLLQMTGHVWVISTVEHWHYWHWQGRKLESHDILGYDVRRKERRRDGGKGANGDESFKGERGEMWHLVAVAKLQLIQSPPNDQRTKPERDTSEYAEQKSRMNFWHVRPREAN